MYPGTLKALAFKHLETTEVLQSGLPNSLTSLEISRCFGLDLADVFQAVLPLKRLQELRLYKTSITPEDLQSYPPALFEAELPHLQQLALSAVQLGNVKHFPQLKLATRLRLELEVWW